MILRESRKDRTRKLSLKKTYELKCLRIVSQNFSEMNEKHLAYAEVKHIPSKKQMQKESEYFFLLIPTESWYYYLLHIK